MTAFYNEIDPEAAQWLRNLVADGRIAPGVVDERSIEDITPNELVGYTQCHFFAGIGGWSLALRLAGWPDSRPVWTGSAPCQPYSTAGKGLGVADQRDLWPAQFHLIRECKPPVFFGEQVASAIGHGWLDRVLADMEGRDYAIGAAVLPACSVNAPHERERLGFVADTGRAGLAQRIGNAGVLREVGRQEEWQDAAHDAAPGDHWRTENFIVGHDGRKRRLPESGIRPLVHGVSNRVVRIRAYGNAIVPQVFAEFIGAYIDARGIRSDLITQAA